LLRTHPATTNVILLNNAASVLIEQERASEAIPLARRAITLAPKDPIVLDTLGWALFKSGSSLAEAKSLVRQAAKTMPGNQEISEHVLAMANGTPDAQ
jgi:Flp pilus assembly protein TadD